MGGVTPPIPGSLSPRHALKGESIMGPRALFRLALALLLAFGLVAGAPERQKDREHTIAALIRAGGKVAAPPLLLGKGLTVSFTGTGVSDADLPPLRALPDLRALELRGTRVRTLESLEGSAGLRF